MSPLSSADDPLQLLKTLMAHAPVGFQIYDATGHCVFVNETFSEIFGAAPPPGYCVLKDELVAAAGTLHFIHKAFAGEVSALPLFWYDARDLRELAESDLDHTRSHGKRCAIETRMVPVFDAAGRVSNVAFIYKDVTAELFMKEERERALKERDDAKVLVRNILDQTSAVIYIKDFEGRFIFVNGQFCRVFGMTEGQILGKADHDLFPAQIADTFRRNDLRVLESRAHSELEETAVHADGSPHTYLSLRFPLNDSAGTLIGVCGISTDITQHRLLERELGTAKRMEAVGLLAGGVAHDFNNILEIILLVAETLLLKRSSLGAETAELKTSLETIKSAAQSASLLTRQLLAFGRQGKVRPCFLDIGTVISGMKEILSNALGADVSFGVDVEPLIWPIHADPVQIEQVLANLCLNARAAMPRGGRLTISVRNTRFAANEAPFRIGKPSADFVEMVVSDTGIGMNDETKSRIFEPFFTTKQDGQGTGLGMAMVYSIVQGAQGEIRVESAPDRGSTFYIYFPRAIGKATYGETLRSESAPARGGTETILLVEDQGTLRSVTANLLREMGYTVIEARDPATAIELWKVAANDIDLILTDVIMPGMSGAELVRVLSEIRTRDCFRVLFVSAYSEKILTTHALNRTTFQVLEKPYSAQGLLTKIREVLDGQPVR